MAAHEKNIQAHYTTEIASREHASFYA